MVFNLFFIAEFDLTKPRQCSESPDEWRFAQLYLFNITGGTAEVDSYNNQPVTAKIVCDPMGSPYSKSPGSPPNALSAPIELSSHTTFLRVSQTNTFSTTT